MNKRKQRLIRFIDAHYESIELTFWILLLLFGGTFAVFLLNKITGEWLFWLLVVGPIALIIIVSAISLIASSDKPSQPRETKYGKPRSKSYYAGAIIAAVAVIGYLLYFFVFKLP